MHIGVDGCPGGWYAVRSVGEDAPLAWAVYGRFSELLAAAPPNATIAVDIPIGLREAGGRTCDQAARKMLSPKRHFSVFSAPLRPALAATSHAEASSIRRTIDGKGMSVQAFAISGKVLEVDLALRGASEWAAMVYEVHPEVSFAAMNGGAPLQFAKKRHEGCSERLALLGGVFGGEVGRLLADRPRRKVASDDVLDALVALWSARRIRRGESGSLPSVPEFDLHRQRMAIFY